MTNSTLARYGLPIAAGAAGLAVAALANLALAKRAERRDPPRGTFMDIDGVRLHYLDRGEGTTIVLLHGNGTMAEDYAISGIVDALAREHRVIAFDRPGFGYSTRPPDRIWSAEAQAALLAQALRRLGVQRPVLVGHSWGTLVALAMAADHYPDAAGLVLLSGYYTPTPRIDALALVWPAVPVLGALLRYSVWPLLSRLALPALLRKLFAPAAVDDNFTARLPRNLMCRPSQLKAAAGDTALMIPGAVGLWDRSAELRLPVTIMAGAGDRVVSTKWQSRLLHRRLPHSRLQVIPGVGHMIHHTATGPVIAAIRAAAA